MCEDIRKLLDEQPWEDYLERLTLYARSLLRLKTWRGVPNGPIPGGLEAADFAYGAVNDVYDGTRQWDPAASPDLLRYLFGVVQSKISNAYTAAENTRERREDPLSEASVDNQADEFVCGFIAEIADEPDLVQVVELIVDGYTERAEIANRMGLEPSAITNLRKKLQRRLREYQAKLQRG